MGYIYRFFSPSGKSYIGQTKRDITKRKSEHFKCPGSCILLENAIKKYGDKMEFEILFQIDNYLLDDYEILCIEHYNSIEPNGYNIRSGGCSGEHSEVSRELMRIAKIGVLNHNFGKPRKAETKEAISKAKSGEKHHFYGKELSSEHKQKLSASHKQYHPELPMYMVYVKERPEQYQSSGYSIINHPTLNTKYFTSKKLSNNEKYELALNYLKSA